MERKLYYILVSKVQGINQILQANRDMLSLGVDYLITTDGRVMLNGPWYVDLQTLPPSIERFPKPLLFDQNGIHCPDLDIWVDRDTRAPGQPVRQITFNDPETGARIIYSRDHGFSVKAPYDWVRRPDSKEAKDGILRVKEIARSLGFNERDYPLVIVA